MNNIDKSFDVVVVGAGTSGSIAARFAAQKGLKVCLIDSREKEQIGNKVCGDAVVAYIFEFLGIQPPKGDDFLSLKSGTCFYSPDMKISFKLNHPALKLYMVDRYQFGQRLLNEALEAGISQFLDHTRALDLIYNDKKHIAGVRVRLKNGENIDLDAKITIDASGLYSTLRKNIKSDIIVKEIAKSDMCLCYREIIRFKEDNPPIRDKDRISIIIDPSERSPGGYVWYFPRDDNSINLGLGIFMNFKGLVKKFYQEHVFNEFVKTSNIEILNSAGGVVPLRKPLPSCADNGIMFIGDAACQVNPANGGGIDSGMKCGYYAAVVSKEAIDAGDYSIAKLWDYNHKVMTDIGALHSAGDIMRAFLQKSKSKDLNFIYHKGLMDLDDVTELSLTGKIKPTSKAMIKKLFKGISRPKLLLTLYLVMKRMNKIFKIYKNYPKTPDLFEAWKTKENKIYNKAFKSKK